ncbi:hypothetical protein D1872_287960 [compost metagenome]
MASHWRMEFICLSQFAVCVPAEEGVARSLRRRRLHCSMVVAYLLAIDARTSVGFEGYSCIRILPLGVKVDVRIVDCERIIWIILGAGSVCCCIPAREGIAGFLQIPCISSYRDCRGHSGITIVVYRCNPCIRAIAIVSDIILGNQ